MKLDLDDLLNAAEQKQETDRMVFWYPENRILLLDEHDQPADDLGKELNPDDYEVLPDWEDLNRYQLMEDFADRQPDGEVKNWLQNAIKGHGAFRRFRSVIERFGLQDEWYDFEEEAEYLHAAEWCRAHHLDYEEVPGIPDLSMAVHAEKKKEPQKPEIRITRLSSRNAMQIIFLLHELRAEEAKHRNLTSPDLEDNQNELEDTADTALIYAASDHGAYIGFLMVQSASEVVQAFFVKKDKHGQGIGEQLLSAYQKDFPESDLKFEVLPCDSELIAFLIAHGYGTISTIELHHDCEEQSNSWSDGTHTFHF